MNTRCPPKRVPSAARFFTHCKLIVQPPQSYSVRGQRSSGQLKGKPADTWSYDRGRWCAHTQRLRCWLRGSTIVRPPQRISMTTVWIELSRVHLWGLQVGTFHPQCFVD
ncbi:UNVERIFIED_CONTAM: hypothetical protein FKN15_027742 [Acipenser sinensis]